MDAKKALKQAKKALEKSVENRYKSRGGLLPSIMHGHDGYVRSEKNVPVVGCNGKIDLDFYEDFE